MGTITLRLSGGTDSIDVMLDALRGLPGVDRVEDMGIVDAPRGRDDSSSAGLPDDEAHSDARDVEIHALGEAATERVRDRTEIAARNAGVVVEWLEPL